MNFKKIADTSFKQALTTHIWNNNKQNIYENISWCIKWNEPGSGHMLPVYYWQKNFCQSVSKTPTRKKGEKNTRKAIAKLFALKHFTSKCNKHIKHS